MRYISVTTAMLNFLTLLLLFVFALLPRWVSVASASDHRFEIEISESYQVTENYLQRDNLELLDDLHFSKDRNFNLINVRPGLSVSAGKGVNGYLGVDVTWQNPVEEEEGDDVAVDLTTAYLSLKGGAVTTDIGVQPVQFGNGLIIADDTLAAAIHVSRGDVYAAFEAARVMDNSPMAGLTLGYRPGYFERLELFGVWFSDRDDTFAYSTPVVYQVFSDLSSEGNLYYVGAAADLFVGDALLSLVGAYQTGRYTITHTGFGNQSGKKEGNVNAFFGDMGLQRNFTDWCTVGVFCFVASGDDTPLDNDLGAFVSITPYNPRAAIFFDPDFMGNNDAQRFTFSGGFFGGVIAPGLSLALVSSRGLSAEVSLIYMYAHQALDDGSQWYGWEADVAISYLIDHQYKLFVQAARFEHGDYYESLLDERMEPAVRVSVGLRATF